MRHRGATSARPAHRRDSYKKSADIDERYLRLHILPKFGRRRINQLDRTEVLEWLNAKVREGYAQATVNRWQVILSHMLRMAKVWGVAGSDVNPLEGVKQKDPCNAMERFLTADETRRLRGAVEGSPNQMLAPIVALLLMTGCRKRELLDARWDEFSLDQRSWRIPTSKTGKPRHVPLSDDAVAVLRALPRTAGCPYVVPNSKTGRPFKSIYNSWNSARIAAGVLHVAARLIVDQIDASLPAQHQRLACQVLLGESRPPVRRVGFRHCLDEVGRNDLHIPSSCPNEGIARPRCLPGRWRNLQLLQCRRCSLLAKSCEGDPPWSR